MNGFWASFITILIASAIDVGIIEFILFASDSSEATGKKANTMWWVLSVVNFIFGGIVIMFFSIIGGVCAIANTQRHINQRIPRGKK